jgi:GDPmannose 4,6-dehydratase
MAKRALITGVIGQDGSYLTQSLLSKSCGVHGLIRRANLFSADRIDHRYHDPLLVAAPLTVHYGDLTHGSGPRRVLETVVPDEVYNRGAKARSRSRRHPGIMPPRSSPSGPSGWSRRYVNMSCMAAA